MSEDPIRAERRRALTVGAIVLASVGVLLALVLVLGPARVLSGRTVEIDFGFAGPIKPGASVRISGQVVGAVTDVRLVMATAGATQKPPGTVRVRARIEESAMPLVTDQARFYVTTLGVLGEHYLDVQPAAGGAVLADGARVDGVTLPRPDLLLPRAAGLLERADALLPSSPEAAELMKQLTALAARLDKLLASDGTASLGDDTEALIADLRTLIHGAAVGVGDGNALRRTLDRAPALLERGDRVGATLEAALTDADLGGLLKDLRAAIGRVNRISDQIEKSPLLPPDAQEKLRSELLDALDAIDKAGHRADRLLAVIEQKKGGAGKLFWDEAAADDLKALLRALREDPVKLLLPGG